MADSERISRIILDQNSVTWRSAEVNNDLAVAIKDILHDNHFSLKTGAVGPYHLHLQLEENRLLFDIRDKSDHAVNRFRLPLRSFRSIIKDYFLVCDSYRAAVKSSSRARIESIDMGRRGLHNEGSEILQGRLAPYVDIDFETARRLFTLLCVLHIR